MLCSSSWVIDKNDLLIFTISTSLPTENDLIESISSGKYTERVCITTLAMTKNEKIGNSGFLIVFISTFVILVLQLNCGEL